MAWGWSERDVPDLSGRVAVVTGANRGLGREVTRYLAGGGARVIMGCRDESSGEAAAAACGRARIQRLFVAGRGFRLTHGRPAAFLGLRHRRGATA